MYKGLKTKPKPKDEKVISWLSSIGIAAWLLLKWLKNPVTWGLLTYSYYQGEFPTLHPWMLMTIPIDAVPYLLMPAYKAIKALLKLPLRAVMYPVNRMRGNYYANLRRNKQDMILSNLQAIHRNPKLFQQFIDAPINGTGLRVDASRKLPQINEFCICKASTDGRVTTPTANIIAVKAAASRFASGTYRITTSGRYKLAENISFKPNANHDFRPLPSQAQYPTTGAEGALGSVSLLQLL